MGVFLDWRAGDVAAILAVVVAALLGGLVYLAWRARLLRTLGIRNIGRRRVRAALVVFGLMLSTTVVGTALGTGDTITHTLQTMVGESLGTVDEVVVMAPRRGRFVERLRAAVQPGIGALASTNLSFFPESDVELIRAASGSSAMIAGIAPAIIEQHTVVHEARQQLQSGIALLAVPTPFPGAFGSLTPDEMAAWQTLEADEVLINQAAADLFQASTGATLVVSPGAEQRSLRVEAVAASVALAGQEPLLLTRLDQYQRVIEREHQINLVLVANHGGAESVAHSAEATRALRVGLADKESAQVLWRLLARPEAQQGLIEAEARLVAGERRRIAALRVEAARPTMTDAFISLVSEPRIRQRLSFLARSLPEEDDRRAVTSSLQQLAALSVLEVKQEALDQANEYGAVITTIFLVLGIFSIAVAILLIFLIFGLLAADRVGELATMRALGMRRRQIQAMFLVEGMVYNVMGAALGAFSSLAASYLLVVLLARALRQFDLQLDPWVEPRSLIAAFAVGVMLTFGAMYVAARRVSRLDIAAATRGTALAERSRALPAVSALLLLFSIAIWLRWREPVLVYQARHPLVMPVAASLALLGVVLAAQSVLRVRQAGTSASVRNGLSLLASLAIMFVWLRALLGLPTLRGEIAADALTLALGGFTLVLATVATASWGLAPLLHLLDSILSPFGRIRAVVRPAAGYLGQQRWRTATAVIMFGAVICVMVLALCLINAALRAYAGTEPAVAGYDLRADVQPPQDSFPPIVDLEEALGSTPAVSREAFGAIGGLAQQEAQIIPFGPARTGWRDATVRIADDGFLGGIQAGLQWRAQAYSSDSDVWRVVAGQPGSAVVTAGVLRASLMDGTIDELGPAPFTVWARPTSGGLPIKLTLIGVVDARSRMDEGIYISRETAAGLDVPLPPPATYLLAVGPGSRIEDVAAGLRLSFEGRGLTVTPLDDALRLVRAVRVLLTRIVQGFMGLGLIAGIAALGLLGVQSVIERKKDLGTLRALGFTRAQVRRTLIFESMIVVALGIGVGLGLGLLLASSCTRMLAANFPEIRMAIPWQELGLTMALAWLGSALPIMLAAWEAGRVSPADALRSV